MLEPDPISINKPPARGHTGREESRSLGVNVESDGGRLEQRWKQAMSELAGCIRPVGASIDPILTEGGNYPGAWIEGTGTISTEVLDRFAPNVSQRTHLEFARYCRDDGLMPYKLTDDGPGYAQIQIVTPLARSVWRHYRVTGASREYLRTMYTAMAGMDSWLSAHRDTRGSGAVEAFCTFDTGHDGSPRFWMAPDRCPQCDAARFDSTSALLPYIAPDLTANVACQRRYLAAIAGELGLDPTPWHDSAKLSEAALWKQCFDSDDDCFYDRTANGEFVRIVSDILPRIMACEIGDESLFVRVLERYLMNSRHLLSPGGWTSLSLSDPRFDRDYTRNSWGGPVNFLALLRAPAAFEHHGHVAELALVERSVLSCVLMSDRFPQCLDPWTGQPGFTDHYSPAILWLLDAVERNYGIQPRDDTSIWFSAAPLASVEGKSTGPIRYTRTVAGIDYEMVTDESIAHVFADGIEWFHFPVGWRVIVREGRAHSIIGLCARGTTGQLSLGSRTKTYSIPPNHRVDVTSERHQPRSFVAPRWN